MDCLYNFDIFHEDNIALKINKKVSILDINSMKNKMGDTKRKDSIKWRGFLQKKEYRISWEY